MTTEGRVICLTAEYSKRHVARAVPGSRWDAAAGAWVLERPTTRSATVALRLFPDLAARYPELVRLRDEGQRSVRPTDYATRYGVEIGAPRLRRQLASEGKQLYRFQSVDLGYVAAVLRSHGGAYIGWERGLGKTIATCALMDELDARRTLIVAPNTAKDSVWRAELELRLPDWEVVVLPNSKAKRERIVQDVRRRGKDARPLAFIVHYEALALIAGKTRNAKGRLTLGDGWRALGEWDLVVLDEGHRIKNARSQMARAAKRIPSRARVVLSGSIIENELEEMFSPLQFLFPDRYRSKWRDWNDRYLNYVMGDFGQICVGVKDDRLDELRDELGVFLVYRRKEDELDLPKKTEQTLLVDLTPRQRKAYDELRDTFLTQLDDGTIVKAADGLAQLTRLRQVATGLDLFGAVQDSTKIDTAVELILDNDQPTVVFSWYKAAAHALANALRRHRIDPFIVDGDVPQRERGQLIARFQAGEGRVFIGTLSTLGESVNLQRASAAIFLDRAWNPALNAQATDRIYRIGQRRPVTITHLVARDTVDELRVQPTLATKEALRAAVLGA